MKVSGFTIIRNAIKFDYPAVEAILSILPVCDEMIVLVGNSEDDTRKMIENLNEPKIKIYDSVWDDNLRVGGKVLAVETDKAKALISKDADWCFYIQADEVIHEKYHQNILEAMKKYKNDKSIDGLLFDYTHFYGSYDFVGDSRRWYRNEIRIVRNSPEIHSFRDAQGFRKNDKLMKVRKIDAQVYHYGWVKPPEQQQAKQESFHKMWHDDNWMKKNIKKQSKFDYSQIDSLKKFEGTHPQVMQARIDKINWQFDFDPTQKKLSIKNKILMAIEKFTGYRIGEYKNYKL
jgi:hypothetical protein